ncbi:MAG: zinc ribbon domain-containing protein [Xanthomonadales bacterium]|nr:zinc ribbon domain-containing protein [Xanthomonadales bacterium]
MPIYEYGCTHCGHELERLQRMSDAPLTDCPECAKPALKRLVSAAGFRLKGSGWYETDFKKDGKRNLADSGKDKKESAAGDTADKDATDTKADSKKVDAKTDKKPSKDTSSAAA